MTAPKFFDLTQTMHHNMPVLPGDSEVILQQTNTIVNDGYSNFQLQTGMHCGTHIDGPLHMLSGEGLIDSEPVSRFIGKGYLIDIENGTPSDLNEFNPDENSIVLIKTGHSKYFGTESYFDKYPVIDIKLIELLINCRVKMIGMDSPSPDNAPYSVHHMLFQSGIFIIENLNNLHLLTNISEFEVIALPLKIKADSSPARVVAKVLNT